MDDERFSELDALTERSTTVTRDGFSVNLAAEPDEWDRCLRALGRKAGYARMAERLSALYEAQYGEPYLFSEACLACLEAGADILLMPYDYFEAFDGIVEAVQSGRLPESRIDESVCRILRFKQSFFIPDRDSWNFCIY